ncbi:class I SAM-dependent methyltransferase [Oligoflexia bacterium]|nr:class I SAM-dependent methyltransferase [Oligoflexia bacterium]
MHNLPLICPSTRLELAPASKELVSELNGKLEQGTLRNLTGRIIINPFEAGLIREDSKVVYPVRADVPQFNPLEAIALDESVFESEKGAVRNYEKYISELDFWIYIKNEVGPNLDRGASRYINIVRGILGFDLQKMAGKRVLDIGCGPQGSLEGLLDAELRVGLDSLSYSYRQLGTAKHAMIYIDADAERMPFQDGYFDVVSSINSLDHVDNLESVKSEIARVLTPGGWFLLFTEIHDESSVCEPTVIDWDIVENFPSLKLISQKRTEKDKPELLFDHSNQQRRHGCLYAVFQKECLL